ncbi:MAG: nitroreductase family deazaflavin-dependent oxidoreductase [Acidimicrobiia bacterium]|nr:nitroreductase family deazaflavin-dependent oxidoreductase [Acidimicrobiia bacterium]
MVELASTVLVVIVWRTRWQPGIGFLRWFNKKVGNPALLRMAGERITRVHHTGRKSGTEYVTPVWAERSGQWFFIPLPYGTEVDWCRNVLTDGHCALERNRMRYETDAPVIVLAAEATPRLPSGLRRRHRLVGVDSYLRLNIISTDKPATKAG